MPRPLEGFDRSPWRSLLPVIAHVLGQNHPATSSLLRRRPRSSRQLDPVGKSSRAELPALMFPPGRTLRRAMACPFFALTSSHENGSCVKLPCSQHCIPASAAMCRQSQQLRSVLREYAALFHVMVEVHAPRRPRWIPEVAVLLPKPTLPAHNYAADSAATPETHQRNR